MDQTRMLSLTRDKDKTENKNAVTMEFHISRKARDLYQFDESLFALSGNVVFPNFRAVRIFVQRINQKKDLVRFPEQTVIPGQINAMGLIDEILHYVLALYRNEQNRQVMQEALDQLDQTWGKPAVEKALRKFSEEFPPLAVYRNEIDLNVYLDGETDGVPHRQIVLEEMLMLWLANMNPAFSPFLELFDDAALERETSYPKIMGSLKDFFDSQPFYGPDHQNLIEMLRSPALAVPHSLDGQLEYIRERWGSLLGDYFYRLLSSLDLIREEQVAEERRRAHWERAPAQVYDFSRMEFESERFSADLDWMPRVVLMAKNVYVWLDHLSRKYQRPIHRLDQIPDEDLDTLARWGFSGLWLIGLWERSLASKEIKQRMGNPEAVASAYSLFDYQIATDVGGEEAFRNLKDRAWQCGIRLASDMVPNHVGIDSRWVIEHPDWFISLEESPYPAYRFNGSDLSWHGEVGIFIEDHYYDRSDAAVVFKRVDRRNGNEKYIYHGNDGTRMPWNDTAQLNFLKEEVREAVIQTILHVARNFPIIRFDAAMTLTKKHYQRLWFPEPGTGGAIPSRAEHGMTKDQFNQFMPEEFWRQVVDRVAQEAPDTLLLAEAFWLLEGYFVRTLGMHRVYNSAFMNMLKDEENAKYRSVIKNTLEFNPEILKRFVNFMSNPDEETAVFQFGKGDKYFGICMMMITLPGLPMFGHGQIEGFSEKYGMEYRYAKWDEQPDWDLVQRHEREIFPLIKRRYLFADVKNFLLYDFFAPEGYVNENVFAYSNRVGDERALVIFNNKYEDAKGWIRTSAAYSIKSGEGDERTLIQKTLGQGLGLTADGSCFCIFRDHVTGLEYIRNSKELWEKGLYAELGAFKYQVLIDFREVQDNQWHQYSRLAAYLYTRGTPDIEETWKEILLQPLHHAFRELLNQRIISRVMGARLREDLTPSPPPYGRGLQNLLNEIEQKTVSFLREAKKQSGGSGDETLIAKEIRRKLETILQLAIMADRFPWTISKQERTVMEFLQENLIDTPSVWGTLLGWLFIHRVGKIVDLKNFQEQSRTLIEEWRLERILVNQLLDSGLEEGSAQRLVPLIKVLTRHQTWFETGRPDENQAFKVLDSLLKDNEIQKFIQVNRHDGVLWFNKESFEELLFWLMLTAVVEIGSSPLRSPTQVVKEIDRCYEIIQGIQEAEEKSNYQVEKLLLAVKQG
ncbi:MAG TPA: alpha-amylase family glycosyl hydrolase [Thermodesulfobacteriota bacterium]|nr:alpha-amylase family glycosyl hydrolase [Thermodesulfobacteriota bacterium]